ARRIIADAPDDAWIRALVNDLDRQVRAGPLDRLLVLWGLSASAAARVFGISRQAVSKWRRSGPPAGRAPALAALAAATDLLDRHVKRENIPAVVRRPAASLGGKSLYELACAGRHVEVRDAIETMFDLRRIQP
ncbi:MAG: hypothetical protein HYZ27_07050, partial [Deltaproteobacteria bacterium]|nr:hypothetical protein [Deltaproteobacteria bacterium]